MKQFGDAVILVKNGAEMNALVFQSQMYPDVEHLAVVYLDPKSSATVLTGMQVDAAIKKEFGVTAWAEGKPVGWKEVGESESSAQLASAREVLSEYDKKVDGLQAELERVTEERDTLLAAKTPTPEQTAELDKEATTPDAALPSAADLDAVTAESPVSESSAGPGFVTEPPQQ